MEESARDEVRKLVNQALTNANFLPQPPRLFHYTNSRGFEGIVSTNELWATNAKFLNDAAEVRYGCELALPLLRARQERVTFEPWNEVLGNARALLGDRGVALNSAVLPEFTDAYVVCFCEKDDLLSQWRTYGASGGGYAIEFALHVKSVSPGLPCWQIFLAAVRYKPEEQGRLLNELLNQVERVAEDIRSGKQPLYGEEKASLLAAVAGPLLSSWLYTVKDQAFSSEHEWRLVLLPSVGQHGYLDYEHLLFRGDSIGQVPYFTVRPDCNEQGSCKLPIEGVKCGPNLVHPAAEHSVRLFLRKHGFAKAASNVSSSSIPVRRT